TPSPPLTSFSRPPPPRDLPSFPTRRSSDLIGTPRLLLNSRSKQFPDGLANRSGLVGKRLMFHPYAMVTGLFPESLEGYKGPTGRSEEHTSELQSRRDLVCRLLLEKKKKNKH